MFESILLGVVVALFVAAVIAEIVALTADARSDKLSGFAKLDKKAKSAFYYGTAGALLALCSFCAGAGLYLTGRLSWLDGTALSLSACWGIWQTISAERTLRDLSFRWALLSALRERDELDAVAEAVFAAAEGAASSADLADGEDPIIVAALKNPAAQPEIDFHSYLRERGIEDNTAAPPPTGHSIYSSPTAPSTPTPPDAA